MKRNRRQQSKNKMKVPVIFLALISSSLGFWQPPYNINLEQNETFVISELFDEEDDEMIKKPALIPENNDKYYLLHKIIKKHNKNYKEPSKTIKVKEVNYDKEESIPWQAGYVDKNGNFIQPENEKVYYINEMAKNAIKNIIKKREMETSSNPTLVDNRNVAHDYDKLKAEYEDEIKDAEKRNGTFKSSDIKEEENGESVKKVMDFRLPKNCSAEENRRIGFGAAQCLLNDLKESRNSSKTANLLKKIIRLSILWIVIYGIIAIPCWCTRGWCCCCCCCRWCRPRKILDEAKKFHSLNPPGLYHTEDGEEIKYRATNYEKYMQKRLETALLSL